MAHTAGGFRYNGISTLTREATTRPAATSAFVVALLTLALPVAGSVGTAGAQSAAPDGPPALTDEQHTLNDALKTELVCVCGGCARLPLSTCTCPEADQMRGQLVAQVALGKTREEIYQHFIDAYRSQEPLGAPVGAFNQLAWVLPFGLAGIVLLGVGLVVASWSRRPRSPDQPTARETPDQALAARLDEELRKLD